ncbi:hypothetical protein EPA93_25050 [Ktedonosporobacter rubrisoli]|uniref:Uncharacterized protein n=1 Tax=Ktedonosporobacter rubrisoli TaxID=2509675 RepID=A0A4P6JVS1_KTERU|nr:hypothetical protein [Ktedonosporobacter rubrisoli]QBD79076.1 hypothetical protein EPA93_25050 [Ktedonosporobacter rubrisoli]
MILHKGERVFWGTPEIIYLEGTIVALEEQQQSVVIHIERATEYSAHLIGTDVTFAANGVKPLVGESPPGTTSVRATERKTPRQMSDVEKINSAAAAAVHQQYGYTLPQEQEQTLIKQVASALNQDPALRQQIINSMDEILRREL